MDLVEGVTIGGRAKRSDTEKKKTVDMLCLIWDD